MQLLYVIYHSSKDSHLYHLREVMHIFVAKLSKNVLFGTPSWFFAKNQHIESSHVNFDDIFGFCTKFRIRNHCLYLQKQKKVVIYPTLLLKVVVKNDVSNGFINKVNNNLYLLYHNGVNNH